MANKTIGISDELAAYVVGVGAREPEVLARLREETAALPQHGMQIAPEEGAFLALLVELIGARRCIEIGTFTGYSSTAVALALPEDGHLVCCDVSEEWTALARRYWDEAGVAGKIDLRVAPAAETLDELLADGERRRRTTSRSWTPTSPATTGTRLSRLSGAECPEAIVVMLWALGAAAGCRSARWPWGANGYIHRTVVEALPAQLRVIVGSALAERTARTAREQAKPPTARASRSGTVGVGLPGVDEGRALEVVDRPVVAAYDVQGLAVVVARQADDAAVADVRTARRPPRARGRATRAARCASAPRRRSCPSASSRAARAPSPAPRRSAPTAPSGPGCGRRAARGPARAGEPGGRVGERHHPDVVERVDEQGRLEPRHRAGVARRARPRRTAAGGRRARSPAPAAPAAASRPGSVGKHVGVAARPGTPRSGRGPRPCSRADRPAPSRRCRAAAPR